MKPPIETISAEYPKYAVPLLLVHGLWCTAAVWHRFMGFLAHRGWTCHALQLPRERHVSWASWEDALARAVMQCEAPPVVVGHDAGALLALAQPGVSAAVGMAPLCRQTWEAVATVSQRWQVWRGGLVQPPRRSAAADWFAQGVPCGAARETADALRNLPAASSLPTSSTHPRLIFAGVRDAISMPARVESLATQLGTGLYRVDGGHALPWERGWERHAGELHRWIIRRLGEPLLILRAEDD